MKGVILAGGAGSRLRPATDVYPKCMALVYDKPMIHYPLTTLKAMGCDSAVIVGSPDGVGAIAKAYKDGEEVGLDLEYKVQNKPGGVAQALGRVANSVEGVFPLVLSDCFYNVAPRPMNRQNPVPTLIWHEFEHANEHSVWHPESGAIIEKPRLVDLGKRAIISYYYDEAVFEFIDQMKPAHGSGELEIVDIHNFYRERGADMVEFQGFFADMGSPNGLLRAANYIQERGKHGSV